ncbi:MAG: asparagine synthase-related protein [Hyphomicrobium sp.]
MVKSTDVAQWDWHAVGEDGSPKDMPRVSITLGPGWGWSEHRFGEARVSIKGYLFNGALTLEGASAARHALSLVSGTNAGANLSQALSRLAGHFALVIEVPGTIIATVDRVRSTPLAFSARDGIVRIDDQATRLRDVLFLGRANLDSHQAVAAAMSGYTIGAGTLYRDISLLRPGEALVVDVAGHHTIRWFVYDAWQTSELPSPVQKLSELHRFLMERLVASVGGRPICVPLSAGFDSRFIAAGLKEVGARNVRLFSYGRPGNHEAETARHIADRLGFPWRFVPFTSGSQSAMYVDVEHEAALWTAADACCSVPFEQDWRAVTELKRDGYIPEDAVIVNGQSGDFITGNHMPSQLLDVAGNTDLCAGHDRLIRTFVNKHFRLWRLLATGQNDTCVGRLLSAEIDAAGAPLDSAEGLAGIHEMLEYQDRQAKYVVSGQRTYEALDLSWRLPLWDDEYIDFWRRATPALKLGQNLYKRVLESDNWGGVFTGIPINKKTITPGWIRPIRLAAKAASAPFGADRWHSIERRVFGWWMDPLRVSAVVPYTTALLDSRGARHGVSWLTERWLAKHAISLAEVGRL